MGKITKFDIAELKQKYKLSVFVQTGTHIGDGIESVIPFNFQQYYSIQCLDTFHSISSNRFKDNQQIHIIRGFSENVLPDILNKISKQRGILFWLDAHLPDYYQHVNKDIYDDTVRFPVEKEFEIISKIDNPFVIIMDDLGMYIQGQFQRQRFPENMRSNTNQLIDTIKELFNITHQILLNYEASGYVLIIPKIN